MIHVINPEFFRFDVQSIENKEVQNYNNLVSVYTDPKYIELPQYKKDPFASISICNSINYSKMSEKEMLNKLDDIEVQQFSMYEGNEYDRIKSIFDSSNRYHTIIFNANALTNKSNKHIIIAAIPCSGMIQPITKSLNYKLYNGAMVVMNHTPFKWQDEFYDKLIYLLIDLGSVFEFHEYRFTDDQSEWDIRNVITHHIGLILSPQFMKNDYVNLNTNPFVVEYGRIKNSVPCGFKREDRTAFFEFQKKKMFALSDIPQGIKIINGSIVVDMTKKD